ncbi:50S ribosomal protein L13 [Blattabacterium sp. (Blaberus giganteus)]|uniref:50S ribosomal protein L13 n=1 Tax=Blattabacterium sp. (Blaberus giganteus) TaxID=1186051 RepID=UPI00025F6F96|nr:50S ribosomal protein L13 [Blattabacterium sp. (Blaberus giganteus)]AFJ90838.1 50S ribosomal protein L13 [Blattabacterium sp. (Blaberus giganteus)]
MDHLSLKTNSAKKNSIVKYWIIIDAANQILGRLSTKISHIIMGKHKPFFSPHINCGDHVIVINSNQIKLSGKKWNNKKYIYYTGYPGGKKIISIKNLFDKDSRNIIYKSVKGMLPKNRLGRLIFKNLHVYPKSEHQHKAQKPILLKLEKL